MQKSTKLILVMALVCFTIMAVNSNCVLADDAVEQKILKKVKKLIIRVDREVLPRLGSVPKTGQTTSYATGDDGDLQLGTAWPNPRFTDNGDGTVTDNMTGLIWLKNANCFGERSWADALSDCSGLASGNCALSDGSSPGDWRLSNLKELLSLLDYGFINPCVSDTAGTGHWSEGDPFFNLTGCFVGIEYRTSTAYALSNVYTVRICNGEVTSTGPDSPMRFWPVRGP